MKTYAAVLMGILLLSGVLLSPMPAAAASAMDVANSNELEVQMFASKTMSSDSNVEAIRVATTSVSMSYPIKARLFGIFPTTLRAKAAIGSNGTVKIKYPWYGFFFSTQQAEIQTKLEAVGKVVGAFSSSTLTVNQQLTLLTLMHAALESSFDESSSAIGGVQ